MRFALNEVMEKPNEMLCSFWSLKLVVSVSCANEVKQEKNAIRKITPPAFGHLPFPGEEFPPHQHPSWKARLTFGQRGVPQRDGVVRYNRLKILQKVIIYEVR